MAETMVLLDLLAFEHARIGSQMKIRELADKLGRQPGTIANQLSKARRGNPLGISQVVAMAWGLGVPTENLIGSDPPSIRQV